MSDPGKAMLFLGPANGLRGSIEVPGDKSISHRALLLGAVNDGPLSVAGFLRSSDTLATLAAVRSLGVTVDEQPDGTLVVRGRGWNGLSEPEDVIDVANSGTLIRLLPGLVASRDFLCVLTGDASIRRRPMGRIVTPLTAMGASVFGRGGDTLPPISIRGGRLKALEHRLPMASAQAKSCIILAALRADGVTTIAEPAASRDHTERMVRHAGGRIEREGDPAGVGTIRVWPAEALRMEQLQVPGDISSAAFFLLAAILVPHSEVTVSQVGLNPSRTGLLTVLSRMGASLEISPQDMLGAEPIGEVTARSSQLEATGVGADEVPGLIDELPLFLLAAARARGTSRLRGAAELRAKESDRLQAMAELLRALGVRLEEYPDGLDVTGIPSGWRGASVRSYGDHRLAMVGAVAGAASSEGVVVDDSACMRVSYPGFSDTFAKLGGSFLSQGEETAGEGARL